MAYANPNLLPVDGSTFEGGTTAWTGGTGISESISTTHLSGTYSTKVTITATGPELNAYSPYINVTAGKVYNAYVPIGLEVETTGLVIDASIEWYDSANNWFARTAQHNVTVASSTLFSASSYACPSGVAPDGAARARILLRCYSQPTGTAYLIDDVYLGEGNLLDGSILPFSAQSFEAGFADWTVTGGTPSRLFGTIASGLGYYVLSVDAAASVRLNTAVPVSPGTEYSGYVSARFSSGAGDVTVSTEWYDAADSLISTVDAVTSVPASTTMAVTTVGTAPTNAVSARVAISLPAAGYLDGVQFGVAPNSAGNLLTYNEYSFESLVPPFTLTNLTNPARSNVYTVGFFSASFVPSAPGISEAQLGRLIPVTPGETYRTGHTLFVDTSGATSTGQFGVSTRVTWYNGSGDEIGNVLDQWYFISAPPNGFPAVVSLLSATAPEGAVQARVSVLWDTTNCEANACQVDGLTFKTSTPLFSASVDNDKGVIESTYYYVPDPGKYPGIDTFSIWRIGPDGSKTAVRGYGSEMVGVPLPSFPLVVEDYEAPLGVEVWYQSVFAATGGESGPVTQQTGMIPTPVTDANHIWLKSPGLPAMNRQIIPEAPIEWQRAARSQTYTIVGRTNPIQVSGKRAGRVGALSALVWEADDNATLNRMLDAGTPLLIQAMPGLGIEGNTFVHVGDSTESPVSWNASDPIRRWTLGITEIDRPVGGVQGSALRTWQDINDNYVRWDDVYDAYDTWTEVLIG